jgi:ABC-type uncharacterized transport system permease subunit
MSIILGFSFLYNKLQNKLYVMCITPHFNGVKDSWNSNLYVETKNIHCFFLNFKFQKT